MIVPHSFTGSPYPDELGNRTFRAKIVRPVGAPRFVLVRKPAKGSNQAAALTAALAGGVRSTLGLATPGSGQPSGMPAQASPVAVARALASRRPPAEPPVSVTPGVPPVPVGPTAGPPIIPPPQPGTDAFNTAQDMAAGGDPEALAYLNGQSDVNPFAVVNDTPPQYGTNVPVALNALKKKQLEGVYI